MNIISKVNMTAAVYPAPQSAVLLCIDDNEDMLECEKSFLESFGYSVLPPDTRVYVCCTDGTLRERNKVIGTVEEYPTKSKKLPEGE